MPDTPGPPIDAFDETDRPLVEALRAGDPTVQEKAIEAIAEVVGDPLARELIRFARDGEQELELRARALIALGPTLQMCWEDEEEDGSLAPPPPDASIFEKAFYDHPLSDAVYRETLDALRRVYHDAVLPKLLRRRALEAAVRAPRPWQRDAALAAWGSGDPEWRVTAIFSMGFLGNLQEDRFADEIREAFEADDPLLRRQAILAAGTGGVEQMDAPVLALAGDPEADPEDRLAAIAALAELVPAGAAELLRRIRAADPDPEIAEAAEDALEEVLLFTAFELDAFPDPNPDDQELP